MPSFFVSYSFLPTIINLPAMLRIALQAGHQSPIGNHQSSIPTL